MKNSAKERITGLNAKSAIKQVTSGPKEAIMGNTFKQSGNSTSKGKTPKLAFRSSK